MANLLNPSESYKGLTREGLSFYREMVTGSQQWSQASMPITRWVAEDICFKREEGDTEDPEALHFVSFLEVKYSTSCYSSLLSLEGKLDGHFVIAMHLNLFAKDLLTSHSQYI